MGGRKTYSARKVLGDLRQSTSERKRLSAAISEEDPKKISQATLDAFRKSDYAVDNLSKILDMADIFEEVEGKDIETKNVKQVVTDFWNKTKDERNIKTEAEIDRNLIESATKVLKRGGKK